MRVPTQICFTRFSVIRPLSLSNNNNYINHRLLSTTLTETEEKKPSKKKKKKKKAVFYEGPSDGAKKDTTTPLPDTYHPQYVEAAWVEWWEARGFFSTPLRGPEEQRYSLKPQKQQPKKFSLVLPPPNVTGNLHIGHALTVSVQDAMCRWRRMCGDEVTWVPGFDHAGIATQSVVEKKIMVEEGKTREQLGRDEFDRRVRNWKDEKVFSIENQLRRLGSSVDWGRSVFTLDRAMCDAVDEAFVRLHDDGLIYRSTGLVNWCCHLGSTISDVEVENVAISGKTKLAVPGYDGKVTFGVISFFAYPLAEEDDGVNESEIVVATTRLETMLGDVAVAVHPDDDRYKRLVGKTLKHPFRDCSIPVIADPAVNREFGTGAVKVTPAHDKDDFELARRHPGLASLIMLDEAGHVTSDSEQFGGLPRFVARRKMKLALESMGLFRGEHDHAMTLPVCSRSGDVIEPMLKEQWFLNCGEMAAKALEAVDSGQLEFIPAFHTKIWKHFLSQQRDWCISRQLWWGHRIPAYRVTSSSSSASSASLSDNLWISALNEAEAGEKASTLTGLSSSRLTLNRDPDVLDTWFSSALFPFSSLGWPSQGTLDPVNGTWRDREGLYPLSLMETGHDILFFWVARMVMLGLHLTKTFPFRRVLLHGMVRDAHGRKMSKSLGNVVDPLDVITGKDLEALGRQLERSGLNPAELDKATNGQKKSFPQGIPECGTDALRFGLCSCDVQSMDISIDILNIRHHSHFCNKIWQATRFFFLHIDARNFRYVLHEDDCQLSDEDARIMGEFQTMVDACNSGLEEFKLHFATVAIHDFFWFKLCDVYLEYSKPFLLDLESEERNVRLSVLFFCLEGSMRALHPFMPFLTEELWQRLKRFHPSNGDVETICLAEYPKRDDINGARNVPIHSSLPDLESSTD